MNKLAAPILAASLATAAPSTSDGLFMDGSHRYDRHPELFEEDTKTTNGLSALVAANIQACSGVEISHQDSSSPIQNMSVTPESLTAEACTFATVEELRAMITLIVCQISASPDPESEDERDIKVEVDCYGE